MAPIVGGIGTSHAPRLAHAYDRGWQQAITATWAAGPGGSAGRRCHNRP